VALIDLDYFAFRDKTSSIIHVTEVNDYKEQEAVLNDLISENLILNRNISRYNTLA